MFGWPMNLARVLASSRNRSPPYVKSSARLSMATETEVPIRAAIS